MRVGFLLDALEILCFNTFFDENFILMVLVIAKPDRDLFE